MIQTYLVGYVLTIILFIVGIRRDMRKRPYVNYETLDYLLALCFCCIWPVLWLAVGIQYIAELKRKS